MGRSQPCYKLCNDTDNFEYKQDTAGTSISGFRPYLDIVFERIFLLAGLGGSVAVELAIAFGEVAYR